MSRSSPPPRSLLRLGGSLLAPPACLLCRTPLARDPRGPAVCVGCHSALDAAPGAELRADGIDGGLAALPYVGVARSLVAAIKFGRLRSAAELAAALIESRAGSGLLAGMLVPVPPAPLRLARRGMDPAREVAAALSQRTGLPLAQPLRRRDLRRQRGRGRAQRLRHPPRVVATRAVPEVVVLVDDVVTTGATLDACAHALRPAGATSIHAVAVAAVPSRSSHLRATRTGT